MIIRKRPIISWLMNNQYIESTEKFGVPIISNKVHYEYLLNAIDSLIEINMQPDINWGLPELIMPSFEEVMEKSARSFSNIYNQLFKEFYEENVCGILLTKDNGTIVYGFGDNRLYIWLFRENNGFSSLYMYYYVESTLDNKQNIYACPTLMSDEELFFGDKDYRDSLYSSIAHRIIIYLAVKKYVKVEKVEVPQGKITKLSNVILDYKQKDKIKNESGQKVIVLDSRWFRKIVNDNNIFVRGFFRFQNKKNELGEWYKELIFVDSYIRNGYHRDALIEKEK